MAVAQAPRKTPTEGQITDEDLMRLPHDGPRIYQLDEEIDLNNLLPGFRSRVAELFGKPAGTKVR